MMEPKIESNELTINIKQIWNIIWYRRYWIIACYSIVIIIAFIITMLMPKLYVSKAKIMIDKASYTNLKEFNPFFVAEGAGDNKLSIITGGSSNSSDDIEVVKSPLVIEKVIKDNNLKYQKGEKKGQYLSADDFLDKNLIIDAIAPGSSIIQLSYKSNDPKLSYNIVKSIIENYRKTYEYLNYYKAAKDRSFLEKAYKKAKQDLDKKYALLRDYNLVSENKIISDNSTDIRFALLSKLDKRISGELKTLPKSSIEHKKLGISVESEIEKLRLIKGKYEWMVLVENMSKNATNITVLENPKLKLKDEYSEPKLIINMLLSLVVSFFLATSVVLFLEKNDSKVGFLDFDNENYSYFTKNCLTDIKDIEAELILNKFHQLGVISLVDKTETEKIIFQLKENILIKDFTICLTQIGNSLEEHFKNISDSKNIIIFIKVGYTDKYLYKNICSALNKLNIKVFKTFLIK